MTLRNALSNSLGLSDAPASCAVSRNRLYSSGSVWPRFRCEFFPDFRATLSPVLVPDGAQFQILAPSRSHTYFGFCVIFRIRAMNLARLKCCIRRISPFGETAISFPLLLWSLHARTIAAIR